MGTNLDPNIRDPKRRYEADKAGKGGVHRPDRKGNFLKNAGKLFGESPNLRKK